jgi:uncharacterized membrane protein YkoI
MNKHLTILAVAATLLFGANTLKAQTSEIITPAEAIESAQAIASGILIDNELDYEKRVLVYEVEILDKEGYLNKISINALDGGVETEYREMMRAEKAAILSGAKINHDAAAQAVFAKLPGATVIHSELDTKAGKAVYEISLADPKGLEYEAVVDAISGELIKLRQDENIRNMPTITPAQAVESAKQAVNGQVLYTTLDEDKGKTSYEVMMVNGDRIFEVKVDGTSGKVLKAEIED